MKEKKLRAHLNLFSLCVFGIGSIIGAGIYAVLAPAALIAGNSIWLSFLLASTVAILTAFSYCELSAMFPYAGAEYVYLTKAYPKYHFPHFLLGFILILARLLTSATVAIAFGGYLEHFISWPKNLSAFILLILMTMINFLGIGKSSRINLIFTAVEVLGLLIIIYFGFTREAIPHSPAIFSPGTFNAAALIFFVFLGFEDMANFAEETKDPKKNIPRAILISLFVTTILYVAVAIAVLRLIPLKILEHSNFPLAEALSNIGQEWVSILSFIALFSTANTVLITLLSASRMTFGISKRGDFPKLLSYTHKKSNSPSISVAIVFMVSALFLLLGNLESLASASSLVALLGFGVVNWCSFILRFKQPNLPRPFKFSLQWKNFSFLPLLGLITCLYMIFQFKSETYLIGLGIVTVGTLSFFLSPAHKK